jgi:hypothetical protein
LAAATAAPANKSEPGQPEPFMVAVWGRESGKKITLYFNIYLLHQDMISALNIKVILGNTSMLKKKGLASIIN